MRRRGALTTNLKGFLVFIIVLLGTILRLIYGWYARPWCIAHDQIAWTLSLEELLHGGTWSIKQLIHYPHEGGTLPISLLYLCLSPLAKFVPLLSIIALLLDAAARFIQVRITGH